MRDRAKFWKEESEIKFQWKRSTMNSQKGRVKAWDEWTGNVIVKVGNQATENE